MVRSPKLVSSPKKFPFGSDRVQNIIENSYLLVNFLNNFHYGPISQKGVYNFFQSGVFSLGTLNSCGSFVTSTQ